MCFPKQIKIKEVGPRDGFQIEKSIIASADKIRLIDALSQCGLSMIEVTSFVNPKAVPNMADAETVCEGIQKAPGVQYTGLIANRRGYERALKTSVQEVQFSVSASESHNLNNFNSSIDATFLRLEDCMSIYDPKCGITGGIAVVFGCPFEGRLPFEQIQKCVARFANAGVREISLADTMGMGDPVLVYEVFSRLCEQYPDISFSFHPHNTHGLALANVCAAIRGGAQMIDGSVAGLGGCPYAPGASGNIATEDLVDLLETMGIDTGIHFDKLVECAKMAKEITGHMDSNTLRTGRILAVSGQTACAQH